MHWLFAKFNFWRDLHSYGQIAIKKYKFVHDTNEASIKKIKAHYKEERRLNRKANRKDNHNG